MRNEVLKEADRNKSCFSVNLNDTYAGKEFFVNFVLNQHVSAEPTTRHQDRGDPKPSTTNRKFLVVSHSPGLAPHPSPAGGGWGHAARSCLALLTACAWLFSAGILWAAEASGGSPPPPEAMAFMDKQDLLMTESVDAEPDVLRLLIWEGHAPDAWIKRFEKQVEERHGRSVKLHITYVKGGGRIL